MGKAAASGNQLLENPKAPHALLFKSSAAHLSPAGLS
jgi:hypothetical protein